MQRRSFALAVAAAVGLHIGCGLAAASFRGFTFEDAVSLEAIRPDSTSTAAPAVMAVPLDGTTINVDGRLDDPAWQTAPAAGGFREWDPDRGSPPPEETIFKVAYDEEAVYFAIACLEKDPNLITAKLSKRDRFSNSDLVSIYIDPYHDRTTGYNFKVNPLGVQVDAYCFADGDRDDNWNAVWKGETHRDEDGWYAEFRIPFSAVRYKPGAEMVWGLNVYRRMHSRGIEVSWTNWPREEQGFISRFGELRGIHDIPAQKKVELLPYFLQRGSNPSVPEGAGPDEFQSSTNIGGDLKYGVTADLTLNATIQPDFGQVEADPATLNLSPFETFYEEKRPFFIEGNKFFAHPNFNLFYSRRIGTGDQSSRIRFAGKLTGKVGGTTTLAALAAATDLRDNTEGFNPFQGGERESYFGVARIGKQFDRGNHQFNLMGTAVQNTGDRTTWGDYYSREAYTGGADWEFNFKNRTYRIQGSAVGSIVDHEPDPAAPTPQGKVYGTGGSMQLNKRGGAFTGGVSGRWEHDKLQINDLGFLSFPDEVSSSAWLSFPFNQDGKNPHFNNGNLNFNGWRSWIYAGRTGLDINTGDVAWSYGTRHPQWGGGNINGWLQLRSYWEVWAGFEYNVEGTQRLETRGGPLMSEPQTTGGWWGGSTDTRKSLYFSYDGSYYFDVEKNYSFNNSVNMHWNQSSSMIHEVSVGFHNRFDDTQYIKTVDLNVTPGGQGIGGLSYVFGDIHQQTLDITLRSNILFSRTQSLELYLQPYVSIGTYSRVRELAVPDSYILVDYNQPGYSASDSDFDYGSFNLNAVWRWEFRPGSNFYLVWTHGRESYEEKGSHAAGTAFQNTINTQSLFSNEPANTILAKFTYYLAL